jgi:hypothetical protein
MNISWKQNDRRITVAGKEILFPLGVYKVCPLGADVGFCVVLVAEREMPESQPTALIFNWNGDLIREMDVRDGGWRIRFGSCSVQNGLLCLSGDNDFRYCFDMVQWQVVSKSYYR